MSALGFEVCDLALSAEEARSSAKRLTRSRIDALLLLRQVTLAKHDYLTVADRDPSLGW